MSTAVAMGTSRGDPAANTRPMASAPSWRPGGMSLGAARRRVGGGDPGRFFGCLRRAEAADFDQRRSSVEPAEPGDKGPRVGAAHQRLAHEDPMQPCQAVARVTEGGTCAAAGRGGRATPPSSRRATSTAASGARGSGCRTRARTGTTSTSRSTASRARRRSTSGLAKWRLAARSARTCGCSRPTIPARRAAVAARSSRAAREKREAHTRDEDE